MPNPERSFQNGNHNGNSEGGQSKRGVLDFFRSNPDTSFSIQNIAEAANLPTYVATGEIVWDLVDHHKVEFTGDRKFRLISESDKRT